jgi:hypothetical protein
MLFGGLGGLEAEACTPPGVLHRYFARLCSMSCLVCMVFVADVIACRPIFFISENQ